MRNLILGISVFLISACQHSPSSKKALDYENIRSFVHSSSTMENAIAEFGSPGEKKLEKPGKETWTYLDEATRLPVAEFEFSTQSNKVEFAYWIPIHQSVLCKTLEDRDHGVTFERTNTESKSDYISSEYSLVSKDGRLSYLCNGPQSKLDTAAFFSQPLESIQRSSSSE